MSHITTKAGVSFRGNFSGTWRRRTEATAYLKGKRAQGSLFAMAAE
jgi:hypothetical protein